MLPVEQFMRNGLSSGTESAGTWAANAKHLDAAWVLGFSLACLKIMASFCCFVSWAAPCLSPVGPSVVSNSLACLAHAHSTEFGSHSHFQLKHDQVVKWVWSGKQKHRVSKFLHIPRNITIDLAETFENRSSWGRYTICKSSIWYTFN